MDSELTGEWLESNEDSADVANTAPSFRDFLKAWDLVKDALQGKMVALCFQGHKSF